MRGVVIAVACIVGIGVAYVLAHWALIEVGREVVVLHTEDADGGWIATRLWVVDDGGYPWVHGGDSHWMHNLRARPTVKLERGGHTARYRAHPDSDAHPRIDRLLRAKYGIADRWVRFVAPDTPYATPVRLEPLDSPQPGATPGEALPPAGSPGGATGDPPAAPPR
jgi:hypothetical protein